MPGGRALRDRCRNPRHIVRGQLHPQRADILVQPPRVPRARDRHHVRPLRQHPGQRELRRRAALLLRDRLDARDQFAVAIEVLLLEPRMRRASAIDIGERLDRPGQEAAPQRRIGDEADAQRRVSSRASPPPPRGTAANTRSAPPRSDAPHARAVSSPATPRTARDAAPCPAAPASPSRRPCPRSAPTDRRDAGSRDRSRRRPAAAGSPRTPASRTPAGRSRRSARPGSASGRTWSSAPRGRAGPCSARPITCSLWPQPYMSDELR